MAQTCHRAKCLNPSSMKKNSKAANSKFNNNAYTYHDLDKLNASHGKDCYINYNRETKRDAKIETDATFVQSITRYDSTYLLYSYMAGGKEYAFLWETPYDEMHRAYGKKNSTWYDSLNEGYVFRIRYDAGDPRRHFIPGEKIKFDGAVFAGKK